MSDKVYLVLEEDQLELLTPLFNRVHEAYMAGKEGMILSQLKEEARSIAIFIPHEYAKRIRDIMKEMEEKNAP